MAPAVLEGLPQELEHRWSGQIEVLSVEAAIQPDSSGEDAVFVTMTLSDPPAGHDTWPTDDIWVLRRMVRSAMQRVAPDFDMPWFLQLQAEHPDDHGDDEMVVEVDTSDA